ncbi:MAG: hypothetical protein U1E51_28695 [Candidatus Binatia bacterium]|nr:hypothetical protein [Candidatus Binatia bacterium]
MSIKRWTTSLLILGALTLASCSTLIGQGTRWPVPSLPDPPRLEYGFQQVAGSPVYLAITLRDKEALVRYITELERELSKATATIEIMNSKP